MSSFTERLSELRTEKKKTHQDMADMLGVTRQAFGQYESGKREPDYDTLQRLADFFKVNTDYLLGRTDERQPVEDAENHSKNLTVVESKMRFFEELERELRLDLSDPNVQKMLKRAAKVIFTDED